MHRYLFVVSLAVAFVFCLGSGCGERKEDGVVRREGQPDFVEVFDEALMDAAIAEAKSTLGTFVSALKAGSPDTSSLTIKKGFACGDEEMEYIWIGGVRLVGTDFEGTIDNEPVKATGVKLGQTVQVKQEEVVDWMFLDRGRLRGGYTIVALVYGSEEEAKYEKAMKIDWSQYAFLKGRK